MIVNHKSLEENQNKKLEQHKHSQLVSKLKHIAKWYIKTKCKSPRKNQSSKLQQHKQKQFTIGVQAHTQTKMNDKRKM
jgi:hypothetical protein